MMAFEFRIIVAILLGGGGVLPQAGADSFASTPAILAELKAMNSGELARVFLSGDLAHAQVAAKLLVGDWDTLRANYDLLIETVLQATTKMEPATEIPKLSIGVPGVTVLPRGMLILARMPAVIREAPLGPERDTVSERFLNFLEKELLNSASPLPRQLLVQNLVDTVYFGGLIVPERNGERVTKRLMALADDSDCGVRLTALWLLVSLAHTQNGPQRTVTHDFLLDQVEKEKQNPKLTPELNKAVLRITERIQSQVEKEMAETAGWSSGAMDEREYRNMANADTGDLLNAFLYGGGIKSERAIQILSQREGTLPLVLAALESQPSDSLFEAGLLAYANPISMNVPEAEKRRRDQLLDYVQTTLTRPLSEEKRVGRYGRELAALKVLGQTLDRGTYATYQEVKLNEVPRLYGRERVLDIFVVGLDHSDWSVRSQALSWLEDAVRDCPGAASGILPELEKRAQRLATQYGYGKEEACVERQRLEKEAGRVPEEWDLYHQLMSILESAGNAPKDSQKE